MGDRNTVKNEQRQRGVRTHTVPTARRRQPDLKEHTERWDI